MRPDRKPARITSTSPVVLPASFADLCDAIDAATWAYDIAAARLEGAVLARQRGMALPGEDALFDCETAAGCRRSDLFLALLAWPAPSPADMARKLMFAADELHDPGDDCGITLAKLAMAEAAAMLRDLAPACANGGAA